MANPIQIRRVTGALVEILEAGSRTYETVRDKPFGVPGDVAAALLNDGTGRFAAAKSNGADASVEVRH